MMMMMTMTMTSTTWTSTLHREDALRRTPSLTSHPTALELRKEQHLCEVFVHKTLQGSGWVCGGVGHPVVVSEHGFEDSFPLRCDKS
eukprot:3946511-Amphidinium_carterae.1